MLVYLLRISTPYDDVLSVHPCRDDALSALHDYVIAEWDDGLTDQFGPRELHSPEAIIDLYFETMDTAHDPEFYTLTETTLRLHREPRDHLTSAAPAMLATLRQALEALNTTPRFKVGDTDSYAIASRIQRVINQTTARE